MNRETFSKILKLTSPIFFGYISIGIPFGLMVVQAGYQWWLAPLMCLTMFTGSGQYIAIGLFAVDAPFSAMIIAQIMTGIRHIVYGLSLITKFKNVGKWKPYLIFALTDETYALLTSCEVPEDVRPGTFYGVIALMDQCYWTLGAIIGAVAGTLINFPLEGIDFALTALFAVILVEQIRSSKNFVPAAIGLSTAIIAVLLGKAGIISDGNMLIAALSLGIGALMFTTRKKAGAQ